MPGGWITCRYCGRGACTNTSLIENDVCFSCYMKGKGPGDLEAEE